jgi:hypothetical protein
VTNSRFPAVYAAIVCGIFQREPALPSRVFGYESGIVSQHIAERKPLLPEVASRFGEVKTVRQLDKCSDGLAKWCAMPGRCGA